MLKYNSNEFDTSILKLSFDDYDVILDANGNVAQIIRNTEITDEN